MLEYAPTRAYIGVQIGTAVTRTYLTVWSLVLILALPGFASAGDLRLAIQAGRVTLSARNVTLRQVLLEWERVGGTRFENRDRVPDTALTIEFLDVPEDQALETLLRSTAGYLALTSLEPASGASQFSRVFLMPGPPTAALATSARGGSQPSVAGPPTESGRPSIERRVLPDGRIVAVQGSQVDDFSAGADDELESQASGGDFRAASPQPRVPPGQLQRTQVQQELVPPGQYPQGQFLQVAPGSQPQAQNPAGSLPSGAGEVEGVGSHAQPATPKAPTAAKSTPAPGMVIPEPRVPAKPTPYVPGGGLAQPPPAPIKPPGI